VTVCNKAVYSGLIVYFVYLFYFNGAKVVETNVFKGSRGVGGVPEKCAIFSLSIFKFKRGHPVVLPIFFSLM
jgi:hypothetical protein